MSDKKKPDYYSLSEAYDEMKYSFGAKDKTVAGLKLFAKGLFNTGKAILNEGEEMKEKSNKRND